MAKLHSVIGLDTLRLIDLKKKGLDNNLSLLRIKQHLILFHRRNGTIYYQNIPFFQVWRELQSFLLLYEPFYPYPGCMKTLSIPFHGILLTKPIDHQRLTALYHSRFQRG